MLKYLGLFHLPATFHCSGIFPRGTEKALSNLYRIFPIERRNQLLTAIKPLVLTSFSKANSRSSRSTWGNSCTPLGHKKHLNPTTPSFNKGFRSSWLPGMIPPQNPTSTYIFPAAACCFTLRFATVVVGGMEFLRAFVTYEDFFKVNQFETHNLHNNKKGSEDNIPQK